MTANNQSVNCHICGAAVDPDAADVGFLVRGAEDVWLCRAHGDYKLCQVCREIKPGVTRPSPDDDLMCPRCARGSAPVAEDYAQVGAYGYVGGNE